MTAAQGGRADAAMLRAILYVMLILVLIAIYFWRPADGDDRYGGRIRRPLRPDRPQLGPHCRSRLEAGRLPLLMAILVGILTMRRSRRWRESRSRCLAGPIEPVQHEHLLVVIVMTLVNMVVGAYLASLVARIYAQLSRPARRRCSPGPPPSLWARQEQVRSVEATISPRVGAGQASIPSICRGSRRKWPGRAAPRST